MQPGPDHFVVRPGTTDGKPGPIVPLIAIDQLPHWVQLAGVPRELDTEQTIGLTNLGIVDKEGDGFYEVRLHHDMIRAILRETEERILDSQPEEHGKTRDSNNKTHAETNIEAETSKMAPLVTKQTSSTSQDEQDDSSSPETLSSPSSTTAHEEPAAKAQGQKQPHQAERMLSASRHNVVDTSIGKIVRPHMTQAMHDKPSPTAIHQRSITIKDRPQMFNSSSRSILFCRHWCHHGTCKFGQDCRYQHRMPTTPEGLRVVGLKDFPTWYLLMMGGGGFPSSLAADPGLGLDALVGALGVDNSYDPRGSTATPRPQYLTTHNAQPAAQHPSPMDLRLMQGRISALLASSNTMNNRQRVRQAREMREMLLRGSGTRRTPTNTHAYANLHTNASVAANAALIQRQAERQQQLGRQRDDILSDLPVLTRAGRARAAVTWDVSDGVGEVRPEDSASRGKGNSVEPHANDERFSVVGGGYQDGQLPVKAPAPMAEEKLVDID